MRILQCSISCACAQAIIDGAPVVRHYSRIYEASPLLGRLICVARGGALPHELRGLLAAVKAKAVAPFAGSRRPDVARYEWPPFPLVIRIIAGAHHAFVRATCRYY